MAGSHSASAVWSALGRQHALPSSKLPGLCLRLRSCKHSKLKLKLPLHLFSQVLALCAAPFLLEHPKVEEMFPADAIARARKILSSFKGGVGAYTDSRGNPLVREEVARFIEKRDGVSSNPDVGSCLAEATLVWPWHGFVVRSIAASRCTLHSSFALESLLSTSPRHTAAHLFASP